MEQRIKVCLLGLDIIQPNIKIVLPSPISSANIPPLTLLSL